MGKSKDATFAQDAARRLYVEFALTTIYAIGVCGAIVASSQMTMEILNAPRLLLVALARTSCPGVAAAERVCVWRRWGGGGSVGAWRVGVRGCRPPSVPPRLVWSLSSLTAIPNAATLVPSPDGLLYTGLLSIRGPSSETGYFNPILAIAVWLENRAKGRQTGFQVFLTAFVQTVAWLLGVVIVLVVFPGALKPSVLIGLPRLSNTTTLFTGLVRFTVHFPRSSPIPPPLEVRGMPSCRLPCLGLMQPPTQLA